MCVCNSPMVPEPPDRPGSPFQRLEEPFWMVADVLAWAQIASDLSGEYSPMEYVELLSCAPDTKYGPACRTILSLWQARDDV